MALNIEALVRELASRAGVDPALYEYDIPTEPVAALSGKDFGGRFLPHVQEFYDKLTETERRQGNLPTGLAPGARIYVWDEDAKESSPEWADMIRQAQNAFPFNIDDPRFYVIAATFTKDASGNYAGGPQEAIPDTIVFFRGMHDSGVLAAVQQRVQENAGVDPDSSRFRPKR